MSREIVMLGTGSAFPQSSYNSCFLIRSSSFTMLCDAGGGAGIFRQLRAVSAGPSEITHMTISHCHTDHIFGAVWLIRHLVNISSDSSQPKRLDVYANRQTAHALMEICRLTFLKSYYDRLNDVIDLHVIETPSSTKIGDTIVSFFDVGSENVDQLGFRMEFPEDKSVVWLGDEALTDRNCEEARDAGYLICGAFCRYSDRDIFKPYEKHHQTVKDVAEIAQKMNVRNMVLYHSEDRTDNKEKLYRAEASEYFDDEVIIARDLQTIRL